MITQSMSAEQQNPDWSIMIKAAKRAFVGLGVCVLVLATVYQIHVVIPFNSHEADQRVSFKLGGGQSKIQKIRERDRLRQAEESEEERDLDAERRWGIGEHKEDPLPIKKQVNAKVILLKDRPVTDEVSWREFEKNITDWIWRPSHTNVTRFRSELVEANVDVRGRFVTSNATRQAGQKFTAYLTRHNVTLTTIFTQYQPKVSPFKGKTYKKCSVVGNSGLLLNSGCGREIDAADYVFRINVPEIDPYIQDVGYKTFFTTLNPSIFKRKYNYFATTRLTDKFNQDIAQFQGMLLFPCFSDEAWVPICTRALHRLTPKKAVKIVFGDPEQFSLIRDYWVTKGLRKYPSTGLYLTTAAIALCEEVHLYGFWPFVDSSMPHVTTHPVKYHYFDDIHMVRVHDMHSEFELLTRLHKAGVLRLHIQACLEPDQLTRLESGKKDNAKGLDPESADKPQKRIDIEKLWENV